MALRTDEPIHQSQKVQNVQKRNYDEKFKERLQEIDWEELKNCEDFNEEYFLETFISVYDAFFAKVKHG